MTVRISQLVLAVGGVLALSCGIQGLVILQLLAPEKSAYYALGHWFDAVWEIHIPSIVFGLVLIGIAGVRYLLHRRALSIRRVSKVAEPRQSPEAVAAAGRVEEPSDDRDE